MAEVVLSGRQLNRAVLERQLLLRRSDMPAIEAVEHLVGLQAQVPLGPYVSLWSRLEGFDPRQLAELLESRRAVRANTMLRTTIHLVSDHDATAMRAVVQPVADRVFRSSAFGRNLDGLDIGEVVRAGTALLAERPRTVAELGSLLGERWPDRDAASLGYAIRILAPTVQPTPRGIWGRTGPTAVALTEAWLGRPIDSIAAPDAFVVRYLAAFGPATVADVRKWSWLTGLREVLERLRPGLRTFRDERGRELFDLPDAPLPGPDVPAPVRFFPEFDNVFLSHEDRSRVVPPEAERFLFTRGGNGAATGPFTVDGFVAGSWQLRRDPGAVTISILLGRPLSPTERADVEAEAGRLLAFLAPEAAARAAEFRGE